MAKVTEKQMVNTKDTHNINIDFSKIKWVFTLRFKNYRCHHDT